MAVKLTWLPFLLHQFDLLILGASTRNVTSLDVDGLRDGGTGGSPEVLDMVQAFDGNSGSTTSGTTPPASSPTHLHSEVPQAPHVLPAYRLSMHVETSAGEDEGEQEHLHPYFTGRPEGRRSSGSSSSTTSMATEYGPDAPWVVHTPSGLIREAVHRLEQMLWFGLDTQARMLAQEIQRWSEEHHSPQVRALLCQMHSSTQDYLLPGFELGIVLTPDEGRWLSGLLENALRIAESSTLQDPAHDSTLQAATLTPVAGSRTNDDHDDHADMEDDDVNLMAGPPHRRDKDRRMPTEPEVGAEGPLVRTIEMNGVMIVGDALHLPGMNPTGGRPRPHRLIEDRATPQQPELLGPSGPLGTKLSQPTDKCGGGFLDWMMDHALTCIATYPERWRTLRWKTSWRPSTP